MASYRVNGSRYRQYTAHLVHSTSELVLPKELIIDMTPTRPSSPKNVVMEKLVAAIHKAEAIGEDVA